MGQVVALGDAGSLMHWAGQAPGTFCQPMGTTQQEATTCQGDPAAGAAPGHLHGVGHGVGVLSLHLDLLIKEKLILSGHLSRFKFSHNHTGGGGKVQKYCFFHSLLLFSFPLNFKML